MTRDEHLVWAKQRALELLDAGDLPGAVTSMVSDVNKHPDEQIDGSSLRAVLMACMTGDAAAVRAWIESFV